MWPGSSRFTSLFQQWGARYGVPVWVLQATAAKESSFNPNADAGGRDGIGLMQVTWSTARGLGFGGARDQLLDPSLNVQLGAKLLAQLRRRYPQAPWDHIYSAYRAGSIRRDAAGKLLEKDEQYLPGWRRAADFFRSGWRDAPDFPAAGSPPASPSPASPSPAFFCGCGNNNGGLIVQMQGIPTFGFKYIETDPAKSTGAVGIWQRELEDLGAAGYSVSCMVGTLIVCARISGVVPLPGTGIVGAPS